MYPDSRKYSKQLECNITHKIKEMEKRIDNQGRIQDLKGDGVPVLGNGSGQPWWGPGTVFKF